MKAKRLSIFYILIPVSLITGSSFFVKQTMDYRFANRMLILQNDSLKSVIIELNHKIEDFQKDSISTLKKSCKRAKRK